MSRILTVIVMVVVLVFGIFLGARLNRGGDDRSGSEKKIFDAYTLIRDLYVDDVQVDSLAGAGIRGMVESLDPHSVYLDPEEVSFSQAEFDGNFDGIGIEFDIINDTLLVVTPLSGGPSAAVGIAAGDRIVAIDSVSAIGITHQEVLRKLRGKRGTTVKLKVFRPLSGKVMDFLVTRGRISTSSIDAAFMIDKSTGYIRLSRFVATTSKEFRKALETLRKQGMKRLIVDLRGNPGGFLEEAVQVADEFLGKERLVVYTKSTKNAVEDVRYESKAGDGFESGSVVVLVDKGSASASEILAGAIQDNKRGVIIGELTFGKGLVQRQFEFTDGSALRLTVSRYYTPSGRQIQRTYRKGGAGRESYYKDAIVDVHPEKLFTDPGGFLYLKNKDISVYATGSLSGLLSNPVNGSTFREGQYDLLKDSGGIIPDYWVIGRPYAEFYQELYRTGSFEYLAQRVLDDPQSTVQQYRESLDRFMSGYSQESRLEALVIKVCAEKKITFNKRSFLQEQKQIALAVKARLAHRIFGAEGQIRVYIMQSDPLIEVAAKVMGSGEASAR
ncbi:MAG: S41 family peptidase [Chlorobium sp.]|jgi:carboxyl-terminal processing protease|uniref:S41 family peptidase n=1 Tax=Chlorobium sp. TaxID=1095 RepID=UPI0025BBD8A8|nr:S41 family peptidase [Chlorobium sp.]MCF8216226.1 S41 family peptidase [Chlorobium sp.]MCF8271128.1 S41 family peptidase [Chlorobium sp.]MCF8287502.1 S41 family peptidase [Chlorobium sp.]MCF8291041.1 S41 family peptidase [Chlorobium sp.]MCF8385136.1 S41 family peptidase [Chlorobium sp.]